MAKNPPAAVKKYKPVTHVIFDLDGLLLDTETVYEQIMRDILAQYHKSLPMDVRFKILGSTERRSAEILVTETNMPITVDEYLTIYRRMCKERLGKSALMKGAQCLICHLHRHKIPFALATSSPEDMYAHKTSIHRDIFDLFHHRVCGSTDPEVKQGKPAPDIYLICAKRFPDTPDPSRILVFEDAPNGVQAANAAGMQVSMVPDSRVSAEARAKATMVLNSLADFQPEQFGLPPYPVRDDVVLLR